MIAGLLMLALALLLASGIQMALIGRLFPVPMIITGVISPLPLS